MNTIRKQIPVFLIPPVLAVLVYAGCFSAGFVYDDYLVIADNPYIGRSDFIPKVFTTDYFEWSGEASYRPVVSIVYHLIFQVFGKSAAAFHAVNIFFHALATFLALLLFRRFIPGKWSIWAGAAFAVHPMLSEAVCGISFLEDILAGILIISGFLLFFESRKISGQRGWIYAAGAGLCLFLAGLSKENGFALLPLGILFILIERYRTRGTCRRSYPGLIAMMFAGIFFVFVRFVLMPGITEEAHYPGGNLFTSLMTTSGIFASYLGRMIFPLTLSVDRTPTIITSVTNPVFAASALIHIGIIVSAFLLYRRIPGYSFGVGWFYICLAPAANIIPIIHPEADRFLYLPSIGFFLAAGAALHHFFSSGKRGSRAVFITGIVFLSAWGIRTIDRTPDWKNNARLWQSEYETQPQNPRVLTEMAVQSNVSGDYEKAERFAKKALEISPNLAAPRAHLARSFLMRGDYEFALPIYRKAADSNELHIHEQSRVLFDMAYIHDEYLKNGEKAEELYRRSWELNPAMVDAALNLGMIYIGRDSLQKAIKIWSEALRFYPENPDLQRNLKIARNSMKKKNEPAKTE